MFYPVFMDLKDRTVVVIGGGTVAEAKVESLVEAGASVTVVTPEATARLHELAANGGIALRLQRFQPTDIDGAFLVISATGDPVVQKEIAAIAASQKILVNTVDVPALCDFIVPAIVRSGDVIVAISTSGRSPALAAALRKKFSRMLTEEVSRAATVLGSVRCEVHNRFRDVDKRKRVFENIVDSGIVDWIADCDDDTALNRVRRIIDDSQ